MLLFLCRVDVMVAIFCASLFSVLVISSYVTLYFGHCWVSFVIICLGIFLPVRLRISRQALARKKESILPLSFWSPISVALSTEQHLANSFITQLWCYVAFNRILSNLELWFGSNIFITSSDEGGTFLVFSPSFLWSPEYKAIHSFFCKPSGTQNNQRFSDCQNFFQLIAFCLGRDNFLLVDICF